MLKKQLSFNLWFSHSNWTVSTFKKEIERVTGDTISTASIHYWLSGKHMPRKAHHVEAIEKISGMRLSEFMFKFVKKTK